ncbi:uncharacterized protein [Epargyreus clarus]|uniref:uncharacterized protein isoform X1 n=1 Tax=Epargyreus clarus TaxID=520877 RepID=UPI003C2AE513
MNVILVLVVALLVAERHVEADFMYNRVLPKEHELEEFGLKCIPGRTTIRIEEPRQFLQESESDDDEMDLRRSHMNFEHDNENCVVCVCSVEGKDEYCSRRPAKNVNECIRMSMIKEEFERNVPFSHERSLSHRIRRDYIWHNDEIPYEAKASCRRGRSYYSNSINANDTDIDVASDVDSLLDYSNKNVCFFCVCSLDGRGVGCIARDPVFCEYFRIIRFPNAARDRYRQLFEQDRPAYFRQLSYRLRRTMDAGLYEFMDNGGDALCCGHPDGHRRNLHEQVRNKIRLMRRKVPKENILAGSPMGDYVDFIVNND